MNVDVETLYLVVGMISVTCFGALAFLWAEAWRDRRLDRERERNSRF